MDARIAGEVGSPLELDGSAALPAGGRQSHGCIHQLAEITIGHDGHGIPSFLARARPGTVAPTSEVSHMGQERIPGAVVRPGAHESEEPVLSPVGAAECRCALVGWGSTPVNLRAV